MPSKQSKPTGGRTAKKRAAKKGGGFYTIRPPKEAAPFIKNILDNSDVLTELTEACAMRELKMTITYNADSDSFGVIIRKASWAFKEGTAVSAFWTHAPGAFAIVLWWLQGPDGQHYPDEDPLSEGVIPDLDLD